MSRFHQPRATQRAASPAIVISASVGVFIVSWSVAHGVPIFQAAILSVIVVGQSSFGATIWQQLCRTGSPHPIESFGAGFVLTSTATTIVDQLLTFWPNRFLFLRIAYVIGGLVATTYWCHRSKANRLPESKNWEYVLPLSFFAVILGVGGGSGWLVAGICLGSATSILYIKNVSCSRPLRLLALIGVVLASNAFIFVFRPTFRIAEWRLFRLFTGSDDLIYSEAAANSLVHFGPFDSIFSLNSHVPYHWFTFAWTGNLGHLVGADEFTATLHIATPIGFLFISFLVWAIAHIITRRHFGGVVAILGTFAMSSFPTPLRFFYIVNTSNVVAHLWLLLTMVVLIRLLSSQIRWGIPLLLLGSNVALISKVPYALILFVGLASALFVVILVKNWTFGRGFSVFLLLGASAGITFILFLKPQPFQDRGFTLYFNSANFGVGTRLYPLVPIVIILAIALARFPYFLVGTFTSRRSDWPIVAFLLVTTSVSLVRYVVLGASAEEYFLSAGLLFAGIGMGVFWGLIEQSLTYQSRKSLILAGALSFSMMVGLALAGQVSEGSSAFFVVPVILGVLFTVFLLFIERPKTAQALLTVASSGFAAIMLGAGIGSFLRIPTVTAELEPGSVVAATEIQSLRWIRENTDFTDLVASNRNLCADLVNCDYDETQQVIAAFADRQVLIEGPRFLNGERNYPAWARERISESVEFAQQPSFESLARLREYGVDWFYLDKTDPRAAPIKSFRNISARIAFETVDTAVIDLRDS